MGESAEEEDGSRSGEEGMLEGGVAWNDFGSGREEVGGRDGLLKTLEGEATAEREALEPRSRGGGGTTTGLT